MNSTTSIIERPLLLKIINLIGTCTIPFRKDTYIDPQKLIEAAHAKASDHGNLDENFIDAFKIIVNSINTTSKFDFAGYQMAKQTLLASLINQININREIQRSPETLKQEIKSPIFVVGFPRTGTTFIHNLLSQDPSSRTPKMWEVIKPTITARLSDKQKKKRINEAKQFVKLANYLIPNLDAIHELTPEGPDECLKLIENTFISPHFSMYFDIPDYWQWLCSEEAQPYFSKVYEYHKKQLQLFQQDSVVGHWVLKTPVHLFFLDALLKVYPDAKIINMQRDPLECIPSFCSLVKANRSLFSNMVTPNEIGRFSIDFYNESTQRAKLALGVADEKSFINIKYKEFVRDPISTIQNIYQHFNLEYKAEFENRINNWINSHPKNKHGTHHYTLEEFGLSQGDVKSMDS